MFKTLLKKQLLEIGKAFFYDARKGRNRSKKGTILYIIFFFLLMFGYLGGLFGTIIASQLIRDCRIFCSSTSMNRCPDLRKRSDTVCLPAEKGSELYCFWNSAAYAEAIPHEHWMLPAALRCCTHTA